MVFEDTFQLIPIQPEYYWKVCDFVNANSDRLQRYFPITLEQNLTPDIAKLFAKSKAKDFEQHREYVFVLTEHPEKNVVGLFYVKALDWTKKQAEIAYAIDYRLEGRGLTTWVVAQLITFSFEKLGLHTLRIMAHKTHKASIRIAEKLGFTWTKTLLQEHTPPGESPLDMELYELTKQ